MEHISGTQKNVENPENLISDASCACPSNGPRRFTGIAGILVSEVPL